MSPTPDTPLPHQRSVWTFPRPAVAERTSSRLRVVFAGETIAETRRGVMTLETSHPPSYYFPPEDIASGVLAEVGRRTICEWKGVAAYFDVRANGRTAAGAAWGYPEPTPAFATLRDHVAFYAGRMDACFVDDEQVTPQAGGFYGGWITSAYAGPFKGPPGTTFW
jgi:uncharacterized protein (DUF427 family)